MAIWSAIPTCLCFGAGAGAGAASWEQGGVKLKFFLGGSMKSLENFFLVELTSFLGASPRFAGAGRLSVDNSSSMFTLGKEI